MSTLTYAGNEAATAEAAAGPTPRKSIWRRMFDGMVEAQQRRADREIARFLVNHGGLLTDDMEREMMRRLARNGRRAI